MIYKVKMVKDAPTEIFKRTSIKNIKGNTFLVTLNTRQAQVFRKRAESENKDANKYVSEILNKLGQ